MNIDERADAWKKASKLVKPIIKKHGLIPYSTGNVFIPVAKFTLVDQHVDQIMRVADWLLDN